jgi:hypothetical protein
VHIRAALRGRLHVVVSGDAHSMVNFRCAECSQQASIGSGA